MREISLDRFSSWGTYLRSVDPDAMATPTGLQLTALLDALATLNTTIDSPFGLQPQQLIAALPSAPDLADLNIAPLDAGISEMASDADRQHQTDSPLLLAELITALRPPSADMTMARAFYLPKDKGTINLLTRSSALSGAALSAAGSLVLDGTALTADINHALHSGFRQTDPHLGPLSINTPSLLKLADLPIIHRKF